MKKVAIYALLNEAQEWIYIGASVTPRERLNYHTGSYGRFRGERLELHILQWCDPADAGRVELETIAHYLSLGYPLRNTRTTTGWKPARNEPREKKEKPWQGNVTPRLKRFCGNR